MTQQSFEGEKSSWHGFDRYDYVMDEKLALTPFKRPDNEGAGVGTPVAGTRRCVIVCPKKAAPGNPWSWQACYWDHQPQTEVELLRRGFHIAYISADPNLKPDEKWEAWYDYLTQKHGLSKKPTFVGMSRGGQYELRWATMHPDRVSGIYADNPAADDDIFRKLIDVIRADVPLMLVCGTNDPLLPGNGLPIEAMYQQFGGRVSMMLKDGAGHHPHSLRDPKPIADFLERSAEDSKLATPDFVGGNRFERSSYYRIDGQFANSPENGYRILRRGAAFTECYNQYRVFLGFDAAVTIITPKVEAPGRPWVLRSNMVPRDAALDQALLAKGFHIVVGPVGYNADGPALADWNKLHGYLTGHGFAAKPVLEGEGGGAGSVCGWAVENPDKVACIVTKNPLLSAPGFEKQPLDHLEALAKGGVKVLVLGSDDGGFAGRYRAVNGAVTVAASEAEVLAFVLNSGR